MKIIQWFQTLFRIVRTYDVQSIEDTARVTRLSKRIMDTEQVIRERTDLHVDVHNRGKSYAILIGEYRGRDYIKAFHVPHNSIPELIGQMRNLERYATTRRIDCHPFLDVAFEHEFKRDN